MYRTVLRVGLVCGASALLVYAAQSWNKKNSAEWSPKEVERLLTDSPWASQVNASFDNSPAPEPYIQTGPLPGPAQAGLANGRGVSDGKWDGGVSRNRPGGVPSLPVLVRWDSALPVREALLRSQAGTNFSSEQAEKDYIISVMGLVPGGTYKRSGENPQNPEEMLNGLMAASAILRRGKPAVRATQIKLDASTGAVHLFFPRTEPITPSDKEVTFATRFGSMRVEKTFRLKDMAYKGKLEL